MEKIKVATILKPQGLKGEVKARLEAEDLALFDAGKTMFLNNEELIIQKSRVQKGFLFIKFKEFNHINEVESLRAKTLSVLPEDLSELEKDEHFVKDLLNLMVENEKGETLGKITAIDDYGTADVYTIKHKGKETLFAFVDGLFESVDYENKKVVINSTKFEEVKV